MLGQALVAICGEMTLFGIRFMMASSAASIDRGKPREADSLTAVEEPQANRYLMFHRC